MRQPLSLSPLSAVSVHKPTRRYKVIHMLCTCAGIKCIYSKDMCSCIYLFLPVDIYKASHIHIGLHTDGDAITEKWSTLLLEVRVRSCPCFSKDLDLLNTQNEWNKPYHSEPNRDALWITLQPWALGKSKEVQIKSDLIRWLHWALLSKALHRTMH